jgi:microsomal dipeptidase-like Zn-dependent dipeptidase
MDRRDFLRYSLALGATLTLGTKKSHAAFPWLRKGILPPGMFVVDAHAHPDQFYDPYPHDPDPDLSSSLEKITTLGMRGSNFAASGDNQDGVTPWPHVIDQVSYVNGLEFERKVKIIRSRDDVLQNLYEKSSIPAAILSLEGASPMGIVGAAAPNIDDGMNELFEKGVRMITVMHRGDNQFGVNMSHQGTDGSGLTALGQQLVVGMIKRGMIVDGAHAYYRTLIGMATIARANGVPIIDSHTSLSPQSQPNGSRLRTWKEMEIIVRTGGIICTWPLQWESTELGVRRLTIRDWARENFEIKKRFGAAHIALGTDGGGQLPDMVDGYTSILDLPKLIAAMYRAGFEKWEIELYMGGNFRRVLETCLPV